MIVYIYVDMVSTAFLASITLSNNSQMNFLIDVRNIRILSICCGSKSVFCIFEVITVYQLLYNQVDYTFLSEKSNSLN